jgi:hypothetical protein
MGRGEWGGVEETREVHKDIVFTTGASCSREDLLLLLHSFNTCEFARSRVREFMGIFIAFAFAVVTFSGQSAHLSLSMTCEWLPLNGCTSGRLFLHLFCFA